MAPTRAPSRSTRVLAPLAALLIALALSAGAQASTSGPHGSTSTHSSKAGKGSHARHSARHPGKHHSRRHAAHKPKKTTKHPSSPALELIPAACEDGSLPTHSGSGPYLCEGGSEPGCEEGVLRTSAAAPPMCAVKPSGDGECTPEGAACGSEVEFACEDPSGEEASVNCERPAEEEALEEEA